MSWNAIDRKYDLSLEREDTVRADSGTLFYSLGPTLAKALV